MLSGPRRADSYNGSPRARGCRDVRGWGLPRPWHARGLSNGLLPVVRGHGHPNAQPATGCRSIPAPAGSARPGARRRCAGPVHPRLCGVWLDFLSPPGAPRRGAQPRPGLRDPSRSRTLPQVEYPGIAAGRAHGRRGAAVSGGIPQEQVLFGSIRTLSGALLRRALQQPAAHTGGRTRGWAAGCPIFAPGAV